MEHDDLFGFGYPCRDCRKICSNSKQCERWMEWFADAWQRVVKPFRKLREERKMGG